ncbi:MAG TPA: hypothetical protein VGQ63_02775 [Pseudolabrys sp.]|jgi:hypothetical protein|nr:hypothetical protein [Pseudolabrys sp.]
MKTIMKYAATAALTGALALAAASPGEARNGRNAAAIGLGVGAVVAGAAIAGSAYNNGYYGYYGDPGYAYGPGYAYAPGYAYDDGYAYGSYAYAPAPAYGYRYGYYGDRWSRQHRTNNFSIDSQR